MPGATAIACARRLAVARDPVFNNEARRATIDLFRGSLHMIRVQIPYHLQNLAQTTAEIQLEVAAPVTPLSVIRALESRYPTLRGAIIEHDSNRRRPLIRFFACQQDISHDSMSTPLAAAILEGREPFIILGAIAGG